MEFKNIKYEINDGIGLVTMNRPEALNALNTETMNELEEFFDVIEKDESVRVLIFTGEGKSFIAGADIAEMLVMTGLEGRDNTIHGQVVCNRLEALGIPTIAAVNGFALGGGCEFAMACDIRIVSEKAKFGQPEVNLGIIPGFGGSQRLPRLIGKGRAKYYTFTGEMIKGEEAYRIGLADKLVGPDELISTAKEVAATILTKAPVALKMAKKAIDIGYDLTLEAGIAYEAEAFATAFASDDRIEGMSAFINKGKANFKGK